MTDTETACDYCGKPVELSDYQIYKDAIGEGMCTDCYQIEWSAGKFRRGTDKLVALAEAAATVDYYEEKWLEEVRLPELDSQHKAEGGK